jgi:hypothetical protein
MQLKIGMDLQTELAAIGILAYHPFLESISLHGANIVRNVRSVINH